MEPLHFCPFVSVSDIYCFLGAGKFLTYIVTIRELAGRGDEGTGFCSTTCTRDLTKKL